MGKISSRFSDRGKKKKFSPRSKLVFLSRMDETFRRPAAKIAAYAGRLLYREALHSCTEHDSLIQGQWAIGNWQLAAVDATM
jgi:hypothetical protein